MDPAANRSDGFTLVELLAVVLILVIAAAIVVPRALETAELQAVSAARMVAADLEYAQSEAITSQSSVSVSFNVKSNAYTVSNTSGTLIHPMTKKPYSTVFSALRGFDDVRLTAASFSGTTTVTFDSLGAPSAAGSVTLRAGASTIRLDVAAATGKVSSTSL